MLYSEFLNVTVARSCHRAFFFDFVQNLEMCSANNKIMDFNLFYSFFFVTHTYYLIFGVILALFLAQNFKTKVLTAQKKSTFRMSAQALSQSYFIDPPPRPTTPW